MFLITCNVTNVQHELKGMQKLSFIFLGHIGYSMVSLLCCDQITFTQFFSVASLTDGSLWVDGVMRLK